MLSGTVVVVITVMCRLPPAPHTSVVPAQQSGVTRHRSHNLYCAVRPDAPAIKSQLVAVAFLSLGVATISFAHFDLAAKSLFCSGGQKLGAKTTYPTVRIESPAVLLVLTSSCPQDYARPAYPGYPTSPRSPQTRTRRRPPAQPAPSSSRPRAVTFQGYKAQAWSG